MRIIKVQRPLSPLDESRPWLVYGKDRYHPQQISEALIPPAVVEALGRDLKGYFEGHWSPIVGWAIGKRVKNRDW